jgi:DNA-binding response OmpR family regulator
MSLPAEKPAPYRPRLVLAYVDSAHAALTCRQLRREGWEVHLTSRGTEARRLARELEPEVVVLDTDLHDESGWLTCAKLLQERPGQRVVLVTAEATPDGERFADHIGALALVRRSAGPTSLTGRVGRGALSSAG